MRLPRLLATLAFIAFVAPAAGHLDAQSAPLTKLYIHTGPDPYRTYAHLRYGGRDWNAMTSLLQGTFDITTGSALPTFPSLGGFDALWIDQRYGATPTALELNTMLSFAATGRRVVIIGENSYMGDPNFYKWSSPFVQALGGTQGIGAASYPSSGVGAQWASGAGCLYANINTIFTHVLTNNVAQASVGCAGFAIGGTPLFDYNTATLWGPTNNVLTILDANIIDDYWGNWADSPQFRRNVVSWLDQSATTVVPEPATYALIAPALLAIVAAARRRRRSLDA